jgi:imidazole glycerol-phosphate synthase subunit HisH
VTKKMKVAVVDHGMGNLRSVSKALEAAGADVVVSAAAEEIRRSHALCVPGQGIFGRCVAALAGGGLSDLIRRWIADERPYLGICLGMQVLFERSEESGPDRGAPRRPRHETDGTEGLGVLPGEVRRLPAHARVPHIGWNTVAVGEEQPYFYFDHSYAVHPGDRSLVKGWCEHGERFAAWIETGSVTGVQFHPEKSGSEGLALLRGWTSAVASAAGGK